MTTGNGRPSWGWVVGITIPIVLALATYIFGYTRSDVTKNTERITDLELEHRGFSKDIQQLLDNQKDIVRKLDTLLTRLPR